MGGGPSANRCVRWGRVARVCSTAEPFIGHLGVLPQMPRRQRSRSRSMGGGGGGGGGWPGKRPRARERERNGPRARSLLRHSSGSSGPEPRRRMSIMSNEKNRAVVGCVPISKRSRPGKWARCPFCATRAASVGGPAARVGGKRRPALAGNGGKIRRYAPRGHFLGPRGATGGPQRPWPRGGIAEAPQRRPAIARGPVTPGHPSFVIPLLFPCYVALTPFFVPVARAPSLSPCVGGAPREVTARSARRQLARGTPAVPGPPVLSRRMVGHTTGGSKILNRGTHAS